jgi:dihydroorotate dehydrogenase (NAD+) catalytic subunit
LIAGATAVQIGTANFVDPFLWRKILDDLQTYMTSHRIENLATLTGSLDTSRQATAWISS